jgi:hypothetical protein
MKFVYRKNAHKLKFEVPMSENKSIDFWIIFEKGRKKSTKGLYRLKFEIKNNAEDIDMTEQNSIEPSEDYEFLCTGFLHLVKQFADQSGNPI